MKRRITVGILGFVALVLILGSDVRVSQGRRNEEEMYRQIEMFVDALETVKKEYVSDVESRKLIYGALRGMLVSLDPYSAFLEPELKKELQIETEGQFEGVGMEITLKDGIITVVSPIEDTPAWKAGVKPADRILEIDGQPTKGLSTMDAARRLRGKRGTTVVISVVREGAAKLIKLTLTRDTIRVKSVKAREIGNIGYLRLTEFQERSAEEISQTLLGFRKKEMKGLILDLRNNPGGLLQSAVEISEFFVPQNRLIVYTQGRDPKDRDDFRSRKQPIWDRPVVVLVNDGSASASEILLAALKDNLPNVRSVGIKTFGKGSVQNLIPLKDGSALKLTIAHYYTPKGICIEGKGIVPDVEVKMPENDEADAFSFGSEKDAQFNRAVEEMRKLSGTDGAA